jgi:hypothetical protein
MTTAITTAAITTTTAKTASITTGTITNTTSTSSTIFTTTLSLLEVLLPLLLHCSNSFSKNVIFFRWTLIMFETHNARGEEGRVESAAPCWLTDP